MAAGRGGSRALIQVPVTARLEVHSRRSVYPAFRPLASAWKVYHYGLLQEGIWDGVSWTRDGLLPAACRLPENADPETTLFTLTFRAL